VAVDSAIALGAGHLLGGQRDQRARQGVDLMGREHRAVHQLGLVVGQHALQSENQGKLAAPFGRGLVASGVNLREGRLEGAAPGAVVGKCAGGILAFEHERLTRKLLGAFQIGAGYRRRVSHGSAFSHVRPLVLGERRG
jgi:hypothetical protein